MGPVPFKNVYLTASASFFPGEPVANDEIDAYIEPMNGRCRRLKQRILAENGIRTRHYAIDKTGRALYTAAQMGGEAVRRCLDSAGLGIADVGLLCAGSSGGDLILPGLANMIQGELGLPPLETSSHHGVCAAGMAAVKQAAMAVDRREHAKAVVVASEFPSRLFKKSRFAPRAYDVDFDAHFLRWMLSDAAGSWLLCDRPGARGVSLKLKWVHLRSFSGDFPLCMQAGFPEDYRPQSYLDYPSFAEAEKGGAFLLRQNIRLLPHLFDVGIHEYAALAKAGYVQPARVDHFLCHYSSQKFAPVVEDLLRKAQLDIPRRSWYSNLSWRGNTGAASIFVMLDEFVRTRVLKPGEQILCFVPESGRFTVAFALFEVVGGEPAPPPDEPIAPPQTAAAATHPQAAQTLQALAEVWHQYRSDVWHTPMLRRIVAGRFTAPDYVRWMQGWIPQVREGSRWMRAAVANIEEPYLRLRDMIERHAGDEQSDYEILFDDYRRAGGTVASVDLLRRNAGGEALSAYLYARAAERNPVGLLGAIYIIEGTGQRIIPAILPLMKQQLGRGDVFSFLSYHGVNDVAHLQRWLEALDYVVRRSPDGAAAASIIEVARDTARLYTMQMRLIA